MVRRRMKLRQRSRPKRAREIAIVAALGASVAGLATLGNHLVSLKDALYKLVLSDRAPVVLLMGEHVQFRPRVTPPANPDRPDSDQNWVHAPFTVTTRISYSHRSA